VNEEQPGRKPQPIELPARPLVVSRRRPRAAQQPLAAIENALRESEARYRQLVESLPVAFYATDGQGRLTLYNDAAVALWGRAPTLGDDRWCGSFRMHALDGGPMPLDECPMALSIRDGLNLQGTEAIVERPDGSRRNVLVYPRVFRDANGRVHGAINALVDITERKAVEAALASAKDDLANQVDELKALHARVSDADQRKDVFLATLAHELRNPLTPIRNAMHVIRLAGDNRAAVSQTRGLIERQLSQLVRLVDDLLDVSRISRSKIELRKQRIELQAVVRQAVETSSALIDHYGHRLELFMPNAPLYVIADPARIAQVLSNLLNNAAKYTPAGGRISMTVGADDEGAVVSVRDNGIGIKPDMLSFVFEMFTQVDTSLDRSRGGLGVGLAIVKRLVEMHGGRVQAKSDGPGTGSEFIVTLPGARPEEISAPAAAPALPRPRRDEERAQRRILVVDDNVDLASSLAMMLQMLGHEVRTEHDGAAAVEAVPQFEPDLIFLDIGMPRMNGYETCRHIRGGERGHEPVIVALSGWGQDHDKERSREAGMDLHLVKPFDPALLESMLSTLGARESAQAQSTLAARKGDEAPGDELSLTTPSLLESDAGGMPADAVDPEAAVEAARYALYRRILPVLRHGLVGELQSVQFAVNLAKHACTRGSGDTLESINRISDQASAAVGRGQALTDWLRPDPNATTTVGEAVHACLDLVGTEWSLRGIEVNASVPAANEVVKSAAFREVVAAMLVAIGDAAAGAADVSLVVRKRGSNVMVSVRSRASPRDADGARVSLYRDVRWTDVGALARAHGINWARRGDHALARFPLVHRA
jgi:signal transduction histidine kinase/DNA-binding response OmpR family regulator